MSQLFLQKKKRKLHVHIIIIIIIIITKCADSKRQVVFGAAPASASAEKISSFH